jgi:hypothetical protein
MSRIDGSGTVRWGETPGEPLICQVVPFPAREDARPTNFLAKLYHYRIDVGGSSARAQPR